MNNVRQWLLSVHYSLGNKDLQNFPFKYAKKSTFIAKSSAFLGISFAIPFAACKFKA
jgi:hypothetical protein